MNKYFFTAKNIDSKLKTYSKEFEFSNNVLGEGEEILLDTKNHYVGYITIDLESVGHHADAPLYLQINMYEHASEFGFDSDSYHGWISKGWIQEEKVHIDVFPNVLRLNRRYAFRYVKIKVIYASSNYKVSVKKLKLDYTTSADHRYLDEYHGYILDEKIDRVGIKTLEDCMQDIFEDGPKRDRRLWIGDLRLQALVNYVTFKNNNLVKKCLYLFAGSQNDEGAIASNVFIEPEFEGDYQSIVDYSLLYINAVWDYYENTSDLDTLKDLYDVVNKQFEVFTNYLEGAKLKNNYFSFIDWNLNLDKTLSTIGVYLYSMKALKKIRNVLKLDTFDIDQLVLKFKNECLKYYDTENKLFVSNGQISYASQVWMILGEVVDVNTSKEILVNIKNNKDALKMVSPYMYHYYLEALYSCDMKEELVDTIRYYWGGMIENNADTFFEIFNPENPNESPYGGQIVHSFCHAWSCTPSYFFRKLLK